MFIHMKRYSHWWTQQRQTDLIGNKPLPQSYSTPSRLHCTLHTLDPRPNAWLGINSSNVLCNSSTFSHCTHRPLSIILLLVPSSCSFRIAISSSPVFTDKICRDLRFLFPPARSPCSRRLHDAICVLRQFIGRS